MVGGYQTEGQVVSISQSVFGTTAHSRDKQSEWRDIISRTYAPIDIEIGDASAFNGKIRTTTLSRIAIAKFSTSYESARRDKAHIGKDSNDYFMLTFGNSGSSLLRVKTQSGLILNSFPDSRWL